MELEQRLTQIALIVFDVDGVLTDGRIIIGQDGELSKAFHAQDGMGISLAQRAGLRTAIITGRDSKIVEYRAAELGMTDVYQGVASKYSALQKLLDKYQLTLGQVAYVGDDINDLPVMTQVGLACAVGNAVADVKTRAHYTTHKQGGHGAVREILEMILKAQGKWEALLAAYCQADGAQIAQ